MSIAVTSSSRRWSPTRLLVSGGAATLITLASAAIAGPGTPMPWPEPGPAPLTRAQVHEELMRWRAAAPERAVLEASGVAPIEPSVITRAQVRDEAIAARARGDIAAATGEPHAFAPADPAPAGEGVRTARRE